MATPHINAKDGAFADVVLMPGDPLRAKYIAETFLEGAELVTDVRNKMAAVLDGAGIEYLMPKGAFYFFPKAPGGDDQAFVKSLVDELILAVPGTGFGCPGHFRMTFCVDEKIIERSAQGFIRAANKYK